MTDTMTMTTTAPALQEGLVQLSFAADDDPRGLLTLTGVIEENAGVWELCTWVGDNPQEFGRVPLDPAGDLARLIAAAACQGE